MTDLLFSIDRTIEKLIAIAKREGTACVSVFPICMELDFFKGEPRWFLDGDPATEQQVRAAWAKARAGHGPSNVERRLHIRAG